jgi:hypothetical protein
MPLKNSTMDWLPLADVTPMFDSGVRVDPFADVVDDPALVPALLEPPYALTNVISS